MSSRPHFLLRATLNRSRRSENDSKVNGSSPLSTHARTHFCTLLVQHTLEHRAHLLHVHVVDFLLVLLYRLPKEILHATKAHHVLKFALKTFS